MKKIKILIIGLILFIPQIVIASPSASISTNASSIEKGKSVTATVTLTDTAAWNIKINGSGAASCSQKQADVTSDGKSTTKKFTLSCASTSEGTITFTVTGDITSGSGQTKDISLTKQVTVTKAKASDNNLSDLKVDGITVSGFSSSKTTYTLKDNSGTGINISATASDNKATVSGTGNKPLKLGKNTFNITVTAENGSKKTYTVIVNKPDSRSTNNYLRSLTIDNGTIEFNKDIVSYTVKLEHNIDKITISAATEDSKASVLGIGTKTLKDYVNEFEIIVKAENGSKKTYIIKVIRKDQNGNYGKLDNDNSVKSINCAECDFSFDATKKEYNVLVNENVNKLNITVLPNSTSAKTSIQGNENLKPGLNKVTIQITAENGDVNEYLFNVYKIGEDYKQENHINIWLIISGIEFIIIIVLALLLLRKNKKDNSRIDNEKNNQTSVDNHLLDSTITNADNNANSTTNLNTNNTNINDNLNASINNVMNNNEKVKDFEDLI